MKKLIINKIEHITIFKGEKKIKHEIDELDNINDEEEAYNSESSIQDEDKKII